MTNFLFWNINKNQIEGDIVSLTRQNNVDVLILAESELLPESLIEILNENQTSKYFPDSGQSDNLQIYTKFSPQFFKPVLDIRGIAIRHIIPPIGKDTLITSVHLPSKLHQSEHDQTELCASLLEFIEEQENKIGHSRSFIIGDLNMNPFENGLVGAGGLHAICDHKIAFSGSRIVRGKRHKFFYNPMWNFFGDMNACPPGTYYYNSGKALNYYWHMFDQVLLRPELLDYFQIQNIKIITEINEVSLLSHSGRPDAVRASDHLPILFSLDY